MDFIKRMKKREFIQMGLKTLVAVLTLFLAIILMEGMIYGIKLNALKTKGEGHLAVSGQSIAYCVKEDTDKYFVIYYYQNQDTKEDIWTTDKAGTYLTEAECKALEGTSVKEVVMHAPNAFQLTITGTHYVVMGIVTAAVLGFFVYKFIALNNEYTKIEHKFKETGTIEL